MGTRIQEVIFLNDEIEKHNLKKELTRKFKIEDLEEVNYVLGLTIRRNSFN